MYGQTTELAAVTLGLMAIGTGILILIVIYLVVVTVFYTITIWITFNKAGRPGWAAIVPYYNMYIMTDVAGRPIWFFGAMIGLLFLSVILMNIPELFFLAILLFFAIYVLIMILEADVLKKFGHPWAYVFLNFVPLVGPVLPMAITAFSKSQYQEHNQMQTGYGHNHYPASITGNIMSPINNNQSPINTNNISSPTTPAPESISNNIPPAPPATPIQSFNNYPTAPSASHSQASPVYPAAPPTSPFPPQQSVGNPSSSISPIPSQMGSQQGINNIPTPQVNQEGQINPISQIGNQQPTEPEPPTPNRI